MTNLLALCLLNEDIIRQRPLEESVDYDNLVWMLSTGLERNNQVPVDKTGRWIGFVQCSLIIRGILDTQTERDQTRNLFHAAYAATGQEIPTTLHR